MINRKISENSSLRVLSRSGGPEEAAYDVYEWTRNHGRPVGLVVRRNGLLNISGRRRLARKGDLFILPSMQALERPSSSDSWLLTSMVLIFFFSLLLFAIL